MTREYPKTGASGEKPMIDPAGYPDLTGDQQATPGLPVHGYKKTQPQWALDLVNANKIFEEQVLRQIDNYQKLGGNLDQRSVALARTHIQDGFMWLNRAVFQPERIVLPEDPKTDPAGTSTAAKPV